MKKEVELTWIEMQVAELFAWGGSAKEVSDRLHLSIPSVNSLLRKVYQKIGINKVQELTIWMMSHRYGISLEDDPWKKKMVAITLLIVLMPNVLGFDTSDMMRAGRSRTEVMARASRARRSKEESINLI